MLDGIRQRQSFTFDEYETMLNLQCGIDPSNSSTVQTTDRNYNYSMYIIALHELDMDKSEGAQ